MLCSCENGAARRAIMDPCVRSTISHVKPRAASQAESKTLESPHYSAATNPKAEYEFYLTASKGGCPPHIRGFRFFHLGQRGWSPDPIKLIMDQLFALQLSFAPNFYASPCFRQSSSTTSHFYSTNSLSRIASSRHAQPPLRDMRISR